MGGRWLLRSLNSEWEHAWPAIERVLVITWLIKDFGWMTTNIYLGWPFGLTATLFHGLVCYYDPRKTFSFYNWSIFLWVVGNLIWMTIEFSTEQLSSDIHWGPHVPVASMSFELQLMLNIIKLLLFFVSLMLQLYMYFAIFVLKTMEIPRYADEDAMTIPELVSLFGFRPPLHISLSNEHDGQLERRRGNHSDDNDNDNENDENDDFPENDHVHLQRHHNKNDNNYIHGSSSTMTATTTLAPQYPISIAFVEYTYIVFWVCKDLFWSIGSGDFRFKNPHLAALSEALALLFGTIAFFVYCISAYMYRNNTTNFLDSLTVMFWLAANFVWMSGEFFVRFDNLALDDGNEGNDRDTRIASACFFLVGLTIQVFMVAQLSVQWFYRMEESSVEEMTTTTTTTASLSMLTETPKLMEIEMEER